MKYKNSLVIFIPSIERGGVEKNLYYIANFLSKKKINVYVLTAYCDLKRKFNDSIKFVSLNKYEKTKKSRFFKTLISLFLFTIKFRNKNITILSFQSNIASIFLSLIYNKKIIIRLNTSTKKYIKGYFKFLIFKLFYNLANKIIVNSYEFKKEFEKLFLIKVKTIYNPFLKQKPKKIEYQFFNDNNYLKIINVARLTKQKDHITLLRAFKKLINKRKAKLLIIGTGKEKNNIENYINSNNLTKYVRLIGYKQNPISYIKLSDVFVLTSSYEGLPNVLLEAQSQKKYILSSNCSSGPKEILMNGKYGDLFKVKDDEKLFKLLLNYKKNIKKFKIKALKGYNHLNRFDYKYNLNKYYNLVVKYLN